MSFQLILVVEADERSKSDYLYIRSVLTEWYGIQSKTDLKVTPIYMGGKGNYRKKIKEINKYKKAYAHIGNSQVIFFFDTDKYDSLPDDQRLLHEEEQYCRENGFEFVWFCHDIEEVFLGKSVLKSEKTEKAKQYSISNRIKILKRKNVGSTSMVKGKSNLIIVLEKYLRP